MNKTGSIDDFRFKEVTISDEFLERVGRAFSSVFGDDIGGGRQRVRVEAITDNSGKPNGRYVVARTLNSDGSKTRHAMILDQSSFNIYPLNTPGLFPVVDMSDVQAGRVASLPRFFSAGQRDGLMTTLADHRFLAGGHLCGCRLGAENWVLRFRMICAGNIEMRDAAYSEYESHLCDIIANFMENR